MAEQENVQRVQAGYAAFGQGDIPAFLDTLADDVAWVLLGPADVPFFGAFRGKAGVQEWLVKIGDNVRFRALEPREFIAQGDKVVVLVHGESTVTRTNREVVSDGVHVLTLRDGKIAHFVGFDDTAAIADAYRGR